MKINLTKQEVDFLVKLMLEEIQKVQKVKSAYNVFSKDDPKAELFYKSFWELDNFVHSIYNKLIK